MAVGKKIAIYGSTGSIGKQALEVVDLLKGFEVVALVCNSNIEELEKQVLRYKPKYAAVIDQELALKLAEKLKGKADTVVLGGSENAIKACSESAEAIINSTVGVSGLLPTVAFIKEGKTLALANKESLVAGGSIVMQLAKKHDVKIIPIDSEHSAIMQCLQGNEGKEIERIIDIIGEESTMQRSDKHR